MGFLSRLRSWSPWRQVALVVGVGFALRLAWMLFASPIPVSDYEKYRSLAQDLLLHGQLGWPQASATRLPAYPVFLAAAMAISGSLVWLRFVNVVLSSALIGLVYGLGHRVTKGNREIALAAGLACALDPTYFFFAPVLASEHFFTMLLAASLLVLVAHGGRSVWSALTAGVLFGLAVLTRGEGLFHLPTAFLALALGTPRWRTRGIAFAVFLIPVVALCGLWVARNQAAVGPGAGLSTTGGTNFYMAHNAATYGYESLDDTPLAGLPELEAHRRGNQLAWESLRRDPSRLLRDAALGTKGWLSPGAYAVRISARLPHDAPSQEYREKPIPGRKIFSGIEVLGYGALLLLALGALFLRGVPPGARALPLVWIGMNWLCYAVVFWANERYRYPAEAALCVLAGISLSRLLEVFSPAGR